MKKIITAILNFYLDIFRKPGPLAIRLWLVILLKLFIIFVIFRLWLFPDQLKRNYKTDEERANHVLENITNTQHE